MILHNRRECLVFRTLAGRPREGGVVTQVVGQIKIGHTIYMAIAGEHQVQRVTITEGGLQGRRVSTGTAISHYC